MVQAMATHGESDCAAGVEEAPDYLGCLRSLAGELDSAMQILAVNGLLAFEQSVSRQLVLCSQLTSLAARHESRAGVISSGASSLAGNELGIRIEDAKARVLTLNRNYSALLNRTRRTVQMFAGLARCYAAYPHGGTSLNPGRTWSSEI